VTRSLFSGLTFAVLAAMAITSVPVLIAYREYFPFSGRLHGLTSDRPAPDFELTDPTGRPLKLSAIKGYRYLFFGFSRCTAVCPATLEKLRRVQANSDGAPTIIFVSVDPDYDSPEVLSARFRDFGQNFIALTGKADQIQKIAADYRILIPQSTKEPMHHSSTVYLLRPDGRIALIYLECPDSRILLDDLKQIQTGL
jgi:protein SCO1/2